MDNAGTARVRPFALGSDMGYAGAIGAVGAPMVLALLATGRLRTRSWPGALMGLGIMAGILTSESRSAMIGSVVAVLAFFALGIAGARVWRAAGALALVAAFAWLAVPTIVAHTSKGTFDRYASIAPDKIFGTTYSYRVDDNGAVWHYVTKFPLGAGLGMTGPARDYGAGPLPFQLRGEDFNGETNFNYLTIELGVPGLVVWTSFQILLLWLAMTRLRSIADPDVRTYLAGAFAPCFVILAGGLGNPTMSAPPFAPWFWLTAGLAAYWLCRPRSLPSRSGSGRAP
jgi:O-antigen ligase